MKLINRMVRSKSAIRFDQLEAQQKEILNSIDAIQKAEEYITKVVNFHTTYSLQSEQVKEPTRFIWVWAVVMLLASGALLGVTAWGSVQESSASSEASSDQTASDYQVEAIGLAVQAVQSPNKVNSSMLESSTKELETSANLESIADKLDSKNEHYQLFTQIGLGFASALFGATLGWILTQILARVYSKKGLEELIKTIRESGLVDPQD